MPIDVGMLSHVTGAAFQVLLLLALLKTWDKGKSGQVLMLAIVITLIWCSVLVFVDYLPQRNLFLIQVLEVFKNVCWFLVLLDLLGLGGAILGSASGIGRRSIFSLAAIGIGLPGIFACSLIVFNLTGWHQTTFPGYGGMQVLSGFLFIAILGLALIEQVIRNTVEQYKYHLKFLCLGLGVTYFYDLYMYSNALLFGRIDQAFWDMRGFALAFSTPMIAVSIFRIYRQPIQINVSRKLVFHSGVLLATGVYLLLMAFAGFYIRSISGEWGFVLQVLFWLIAAGVLIIAMFSGRLRSFLRVYISRNLFSSRYDYREEWLKLSRSLAFTDSEESLHRRSIMAMADIVDSSGGALWLTRDDQYFDQVAEVEMGWVKNGILTRDMSLVPFLEETSWIIDLKDREGLEYQGEYPQWLADWKKAWLLVPLVLHEKLLGFIILRHPRVDIKLNWEDFDLLKTAAQQTASYLAQKIASEALSTAQQFTAFNQMSAFVVHDIKTLNSQLSLMVSNAEKHKSNPDFIDDMISTTEHAVQKMSFLLNHFKNESHVEGNPIDIINFAELVQNVMEAQSTLRPIPELIGDDKEIYIRADWHEMQSALGHLVKNAQEATDEDGSVSMILERNDGHVTLKIIDTGEGMSEEFLHTLLFKPFESTKGLSGMGVGVYQSRECIRKAGGELQVKSSLGEGTEFIIRIPEINPGDIL